MTQEQVAAHFKINVMTVSRWERQVYGKNKPDIDTLAALALLYGVEPLDLYRDPARMSIDAMLRGHPPEVVAKVARHAKVEIES